MNMTTQTTKEFKNNKGEIILKNSKVEIIGCSESGLDIRDINTGITIFDIGWDI